MRLLIALIFVVSFTFGIGAVQATDISNQPIGLVKFPEALPFTLEEMVDPFGFTVSLKENKEKGHSVISNFFLGTIFIFYREKNGEIRSVYSPLKHNDQNLCWALNVLEKKKVHIYEYLVDKFQARENCPRKKKAAFNL